MDYVSYAKRVTADIEALKQSINDDLPALVLECLSYHGTLGSIGKQTTPKLHALVKTVIDKQLSHDKYEAEAWVFETINHQTAINYMNLINSRHANSQ